jgi:DNA replication protein DnaC
MFSEAIKNIQRQYEFKKSYAEKQFQIKKQEVYNKNPRLEEIDNEIKSLGIAVSKTILLESKDNKEIVQKNLETKITELRNEKNEILKMLKIKLEPNYSCSKCLDTGYISTPTGSEMCSCFKQQLINESYHKSNLTNLEKETFDNFDIDLYSKEANEDKYYASISPRENIEHIKDYAYNFVKNFGESNQKNLLFSGTTGLGKTFLSSCIANEVLKKGYTVLYQTAPLLLDTIFEYKYGKSSSSEELYKSLFDVDLLIIDDLGTENVSQAKATELFTLINSRLLKSNTKTIISTNLTLQEIFNTYDDRIVSRIIGNYDTCMFFGEDIRLKR